jgi:hypothetical protein
MFSLSTLTQTLCSAKAELSQQDAFRLKLYAVVKFMTWTFFSMICQQQFDLPQSKHKTPHCIAPNIDNLLYNILKSFLQQHVSMGELH